MVFAKAINPQNHRHGSPFVSRAMKAGLMAEQGAFGNDEPSGNEPLNGLLRPIAIRAASPEGQGL